jgi:hypothetical protein
LALVGILGWEFSNSTWFCANACHDVHPEEPASSQDSYHARVKCVECHMGRVGTLEAMALKASHAKHLPETLLGQYGRPVEAETMRPANESCELCHWPPAFHGDTVWEIRRFQPDEENTEKRSYLILRTDSGEATHRHIPIAANDEVDSHVHWHIANQVEYIATDEHKQDIPWVRVTLPDGRVIEYNDVTNPLAADEVAKAEKRRMDCVSCHNTVGHPFPSPERTVDDALASGQLNPTLPYIKKEMLALLSADYPDKAAALEAADQLEARYKAAYPDVAVAYATDIQQAAATAKELIDLLVFDKPGVTWESFPDNNQHKEFPGCFRCHDGKHLSAEGQSIRLHCNICHSVPVTVGANDRPPQMPVVTLQEPDSHLESNFMADHRFQANGDCVSCHGEIEFGSDDSSFCANSACHGQKWPSVELDAAFPHPIDLEGKHAEVWCHSCHDGLRKPSYECANCHQSPSQTHFSTTCGDCHAPTGWTESAVAILTRSPQIPHALDGREDCLLCHDPAGQVQPAPTDHKGRVNAQCGLCHKAKP